MNGFNSYKRNVDTTLDQKIAKMSKEERIQKVNAYRKRYTIIYSIFSVILFLLLFSSFVISLVAKELLPIGMIIFLGTTSVLVPGFFLLAVYIIHKQSDEKIIRRALKETPDKITIESTATVLSVESPSPYNTKAIMSREHSMHTKSAKEELMELKEMLELGLITEKDYEHKKREILGL